MTTFVDFINSFIKFIHNGKEHIFVDKILTFRLTNLSTKSENQNVMADTTVLRTYNSFFAETDDEMTDTFFCKTKMLA